MGDCGKTVGKVIETMGNIVPFPLLFFVDLFINNVYNKIGEGIVENRWKY